MLRTSNNNNSKQQPRHKSNFCGSGSGCGPGPNLGGWPPPMVPSLNPGFRLRAAPPLCAVWGQTDQKRPQNVPGGPRSGSAPLCGGLGAHGTQLGRRSTRLHTLRCLFGSVLGHLRRFGRNRVWSALKPKNRRISGWDGPNRDSDGTFPWGKGDKIHKKKDKEPEERSGRKPRLKNSLVSGYSLG